MSDNPRDQTLVGPALAATPDGLEETGPLFAVTPAGTVVDSHLHHETPRPLLGDGHTRYELREEIAHGGMGAVFRAWDQVIGREVAVKLIVNARAYSEADQNRFRDEARITGRLQHPGIPPVHDLGTLQDGRPFMAMKLIRGRTLDNLLKDRTSPWVDLSRHLQIFEAICQTVAYAHAEGVIHRDLKPQNVMVGAFAEVQVMDWGLAKSLRGKQRAVRSEDTNDPCAPEGDGTERTRAGSVMGTPSYMAPEQARGEIDTLGMAADVFALGAILCQILTGAPPYMERSTRDTLQRAASGDVTEVFARLDNCGADSDLIALAKRSLAPRIEDRYRDAGELASAVADYRNSVEERLKQAEMQRARAETQAKEQRKRRKVQMALTVAILVLLIGGGIAGWWYDHQASIRRERLGRDTNALAAALDRTEEALRNDDALKGEIAFEQADRRMAEGVGQELQARFERCRTDLTMLKELDRINDYRWTLAAGRLPDLKQLVARWRTAFEVFGIAPSVTELGETVDRIDASLIRARLLTEMDTWLVHDPSTALILILSATDHDVFRNAVRDAILRGDDERLIALADDAEALRQPPRFAVILGLLRPITFAQRARLLREAHRLAPTSLAVVMEAAGMYRVNQRIGASERVGWYRTALAIRPNNATVWNNLSVALLDDGERDASISASREAVRLKPLEASHHHNLALALDRKGDKDQAIVEFREAIRLDPKFANPHNGLGNALRNSKDLDGAVAEFREALRLDPDFALAHHNLAIALYDKKDLDGAIAEFKEAIRLNPNDAATHNGLGVALSDRMDIDGAITEYKESIRLDPMDADPHFNLAICLYEKENLKEAIAEYKEAIRLNPKNADPHNGLGNALHDTNDFAGAIAEYKEAIRLNPEDADPHYNLGLVFWDLGRLIDADQEFMAARRLCPPDHELQSSIKTDSAAIAELLATEKKLAGVMTAGAHSANADEAIRFAELCARYQKRYRLATRFYAEAFDAQAETKSNPLDGNYYNAACYAALAADGKGIDPPPISERPEFRRQARDWLAAAFAACRKTFENAPELNRDSVHGKMQHWLADTDLASIRDRDKLRSLHPDEQRALEKLWDDVRALRERTAPLELLPPPKAAD